MLAGLRRTLFLNLGICAVITVIVLAVVAYTLNIYQGRLESMATTDKLTGLLNRQAFDLVFEQAVKEIERSSVPLSILLFDIDRFKTVNDGLGHLIGDSLIAAIGKAARDSVRAADVVCRWGGDEFLVLLKDCRTADALAIAEKLRERVKAARIWGGEGWVMATVSLGTAEYRKGESRAELLARADKALYQAKSEGRDRTGAGGEPTSRETP